MGALVRVNGGIEKGQFRRWLGSMGALYQWGIERVNGLLNKGGSMGVLKRINGVRVGIEKGQWGPMGARVRSDKGLALGRTGVWLWVRQGCGPDRRLSYRVVSSTLQGSKLYLAGLQALPYRVASSTL